MENLETQTVSQEEESIIAKAFQQSTSAGTNTTEQILVIPDDLNQEIIVIDTSTNIPLKVLSRVHVGNSVNKVEQGNQTEDITIAEEEKEESMDCSEESTEEPVEEQNKKQVIKVIKSPATPVRTRRSTAVASKQQAVPSSSSTTSIGAKEITYEVVDSASQRGLPKLVDSLGYSYTLRRPTPYPKTANFSDSKMKGKRIYWRCSIRGKQYRCGAAVVQNGDVFIRNDYPHGHLPKPGGVMQTKIRRQVKLLARRNLMDSGPSVVNTVLLENAEGDSVECYKNVHANLVRAANRTREKLREKVDLKLEDVLRNVYTFFQNESLSGEACDLGNPLKRLATATGIHVKALKQKMGCGNENEVAIKRCIGGEAKNVKSEIVKNDIEQAIVSVMDSLESDGESYTVTDVKAALTNLDPEFNISQAAIGRILRKFGYQTSKTKQKQIVHALGLERKPEVIRLVKSPK